MTTRLSYKERERQRREQEILLCARRIIHETGAANLNMDQLADAVGVSKPTLYQHFKSKDDLIVRVLVDGFAELEEYLSATDEVVPLERLKTTLRVILRHRYGEDGLLADFETELFMSTLMTHPQVVAAKGRIRTEVYRMVEEGKASGTITSILPTEFIGCLFFKLIGLPAAVQLVAADAAGDERPADPQALIEHVIDVFVRSISA
jgi:AcrR family transcriptional regulator